MSNNDNIIEQSIRERMLERDLTRGEGKRFRALLPGLIIPFDELEDLLAKAPTEADAVEAMNTFSAKMLDRLIEEDTTKDANGQNLVEPRIATLVKVYHDSSVCRSGMGNLVCAVGLSDYEVLGNAATDIALTSDDSILSALVFVRAVNMGNLWDVKHINTRRERGKLVLMSLICKALAGRRTFRAWTASDQALEDALAAGKRAQALQTERALTYPYAMGPREPVMQLPVMSLARLQEMEAFQATISAKLDGFPDLIKVNVAKPPVDMEKGDEIGWFKVARDNGAPQSGGYRRDVWPLPSLKRSGVAEWQPGDWTAHREAHVCNSGWHVCGRHALHQWIKTDYRYDDENPGQTIFAARLKGKVDGPHQFTQDGKVCAEQARLVEPLVYLDVLFLTSFMSARRPGEAYVAGMTLEQRVKDLEELSMHDLSGWLHNWPYHGSKEKSAYLRVAGPALERAITTGLVWAPTNTQADGLTLSDIVKLMCTYLMEREPSYDNVAATTKYGTKVQVSLTKRIVTREQYHSLLDNDLVNKFLNLAHWERKTNAKGRDRLITLNLQRAVSNLRTEVRSTGFDDFRVLDDRNDDDVKKLRMLSEQLVIWMKQEASNRADRYARAMHAYMAAELSAELSSHLRTMLNAAVSDATNLAVGYFHDQVAQELIVAGIEDRNARIVPQTQQVFSIDPKEVEMEAKREAARQARIAKALQAAERETEKRFRAAWTKRVEGKVSDALERVVAAKADLAQANEMLKKARALPKTNRKPTQQEITYFARYNRVNID